MTTAPGAGGMQYTYLKKFPYPYGKWTSSVVSKSNIQTRWAEKGMFLEGSLRSQPQSYPLRYQRVKSEQHSFF